jgi:simple sugar transport system ATP-binding protein
MKNIVKGFGHVVANDHVSFALRRGEIHALLGENGAGKTTLMNILYGLYEPDAGEILVNSSAVKIASPRDAIAHGIGMVHQHFMLVEPFTAAENVVLGSWKAGELLMHPHTVQRAVSQFAEKYGLGFDPAAAVETLPIGIQQRVEIVKALYRGARILILDEPTAVLTPQETEELFRCVRDLAANGVSIIFISHKLPEVLAVSDQVSVLRNGKNVGTVVTSEVDKGNLALMMIGRTLEAMPKPERLAQSPGLAVTDLWVRNRQGVVKLDKVSFQIEQGQILGVAGIDGNGQLELANAITGVRPADSGTLSIGGLTIDASKQDAYRFTLMGGAYVPQDRTHTGLVLDFTAAENLMLKHFDRAPFVKRGFLQHKQIHRSASALLRAFDVRPPNPVLQTRTFSGGNQQKVVLARELHASPGVIVACYPTRGLDIGATEFVHQQLIRQRSAGAAILFISNELEELLTLSDMIAVLHRGVLVGMVDPHRIDLQSLGLMMMGHKAETQ